MDRNQFTDNRTGDLVKIQVNGPDWAFIPAPLPANWTLPESLVDLTMEAWDCLGTLNGIGNTLDAPELLLRPLEDREALQSSKLEGTYANPEDVLIFAQNPREPKSDRDPANDWLEVVNYRRALQLGHNEMAKRSISLNLIRDMHKTLMTGVRGREKTPGDFRKVQVGIGSSYRFIPPPPQHLDGLLDNLEKYMNAPQDSPRHRLVRCFIAHYQFEAIHPFWDGNGRIGRAVLALMISRAGRHNMPWLYMSPFFERHKDEYIQKLFRVSTHGEWHEWVEFCLRGTVEMAQDAIERCRMFRKLRKRYHLRMEANASPRTHALIDRLFRSPVIGITEFKQKMSIAYKTAKTDIQLLVEAQILKPLPDYKPAAFYAPELFRIAYDEQPSLADDSPETLTPIGQKPPLSQSLPASSSTETEPEPSPPEGHQDDQGRQPLDSL